MIVDMNVSWALVGWSGKIEGRNTSEKRFSASFQLKDINMTTFGWQCFVLFGHG